MINFHLDIVDRHPGSPALSCLTGWIAGGKDEQIESLGLRLDENTFVRCRYPFYRGDAQEPAALEGGHALIGFSVMLPKRLGFSPPELTFAAVIAGRAYAFTVDPAPGRTHRLQPGPATRLSPAPELIDFTAAEIGPLVEGRLFDSFARERHLTLRLDLINKCNLRCVMCHYSNETIAKRPAQRIAPEQFAAFFDPIAPLTRDVVLSCGDEPLMSPHFETILRDLSARDSEVRIIFCTNAMLLGEKTAAAIMAAGVYLIMFSFDGVTSETLHRIRVGSDYRRIIKNILGLGRARVDQPGPRFVFNYVMLESNIHEAPLFVSMAKRLGAEIIDFRHVVPMDTYDIAHEMLEKRPAKYNFYRDRIIAAATACGLDIYIPPALPAADTHDPAGDPVVTLEEFHAVLRESGEDPPVDAEIPRPAAAPERQLETSHCFCDRPFREVMIREQRDVYPCAWHQEKMGTLDGAATLEEIFFGENFQRLRLAMLNPLGAPGCRDCPIKANRLPTHLLASKSAK